jgi:hypothetical protein
MLFCSSAVIFVLIVYLDTVLCLFNLSFCSSCMTYGTAAAAGSQVHFAGSPHGMMVAASVDVRAIAEKAEQNGGKAEFGRVLMSPEERVYTVVTDPIGFLWCINPQ